jgi:hypothetical protein
LFTIWVKIGRTLPWIELNEIYETRKAAKKAVEIFLNSLQLRIISASEKKRRQKALVAIQTRRRQSWHA